MKHLKIQNMTLNDFENLKKNLRIDFDDFWTVSQLKTEWMGDNRNYIVAKQNQEIVGFAGMMLNPPEMEIMNIVTKKQVRGTGIGTHLLNKIIEIAKNNGIETIFLEVNETNFIAQRMYRKAGFLEIGVRKKYYHGKENAMIMSKKVNNLKK